MADCNFRFINNLAYTEDSILVYNLFIFKISSKVTEADCRQYLSRYGEILYFRFNIRQGFGGHAGHRVPSRTAFVNFKTPETAASVLRKQFHTISQGKVFSVKACDSWHQPPNTKYKPFSKRSAGHVKFNANNNTANIVNSATSSTAVAAKTDTVAGDNTASSSSLSPAHNDVNDDTVTVFQLNEDCLLIILKYLPLRDQVSLARSHSEFESVFKTYAKLYYKKISTDNLAAMSLWNIRQLFMMAGEFFEKFTFVEWLQNKDRERIASFVQYNCPNLRKIKLDTAKIRVPSLHKLLTNKLQLTQLSLNCLSINDNCIHAIKKLPTLDHLSIAHCYNFTGRFLHLLPQLKTLRLAHCSNLQTSNLQKAITAMTQLVALDTTGSDQLHKSLFDSLQFKTQDLEILQMSCIGACYDSIALLPKLRYLGLFCDNKYAMRSSIFKALVEKRVDQLESLQVVSRQCLSAEQCQLISKLKALKKLHIPCNDGINENSVSSFCDLKNLIEIKLNGSQHLTNNSLLELVRSCPKLRWVNIQNTPIDNQFAKKLLPIIKKEKREHGRLTFLVRGSKMNEIFDLPQDYKTDEIKSSVEFIFEDSSSIKNYDNLYDAFENDFNGQDDVPFFESEHFGSDSEDQDDDDDDLDDDDFIDFDGLDDGLDFLLNIPIFRHFAIREAFGFGGFGHHHDSDDDELDDDDVYLW